MSFKTRARDVAVDVAVDQACQALGVHGVCPIALEVVRLFREREQRDPTPLVPTGDRAQRPARPEERRDRVTRLLPEEIEREIPTMVPPVHRRLLGKDVAKGMLRHVERQRIRFGGKAVHDIIFRLTNPGVSVRKQRAKGGDQGFTPGESGF